MKFHTGTAVCCMLMIVLGLCPETHAQETGYRYALSSPGVPTPWSQQSAQSGSSQNGSSQSDDLATGAWVMGGVGLGTVALGAMFWALSSNREEDVNAAQTDAERTQVEDDAQALKGVGTGIMVVGGVCLLMSVGLGISSLADGSSSHSSSNSSNAQQGFVLGLGGVSWSSSWD